MVRRNLVLQFLGIYTPNPFNRRMTRIMSVSLLLFLVAIATTVVLFADTAAQWSLRLILDEGYDVPRLKTEGADAPTAETVASQPRAA